jgi:hypothetical protein
MTKKTDLLNFIKDHKDDLFYQFHLSKIGIFGSYARGEETEDSDIDLIVEFKSGTQNLYQLKQALKEFFRHQFQKEICASFFSLYSRSPRFICRPKPQAASKQ